MGGQRGGKPEWVSAAARIARSNALCTCLVLFVLRFVKSKSFELWKLDSVGMLVHVCWCCQACWQGGQCTKHFVCACLACVCCVPRLFVLQGRQGVLGSSPWALWEGQNPLFRISRWLHGDGQPTSYMHPTKRHLHVCNFLAPLRQPVTRSAMVRDTWSALKQVDTV